MADPLQVTLNVAASGLHAQSRRLTVVSQNLANAEATGTSPGSDPYTRRTITFDSEFDSAMGANLVKVDGIDLDRAPFRVEHNPGHPAADANGYVKLPNVNTLIEMTDMREAQRSYEANLKVIESSRTLLQRTIDILR